MQNLSQIRIFKKKLNKKAKAILYCNIAAIPEHKNSNIDLKNDLRGALGIGLAYDLDGH